MLFFTILLLRFLFVFHSNWPRTAAANKTNCLVCLKKLNITKLRECKVFQIIKHLCIDAEVQVAYTVCVDPLKRIVRNVQKEAR